MNESKKYKFYNTDITGQEEYDISGQEYRELLLRCMKYSESFSFYYQRRAVHFPEWLNEYRLPINEIILGNYMMHYHKPDNAPGTGRIVDTSKLDEKYFMGTVLHLKLSPKVCEWILSVTDSMFKWIDGWGYTNPEDPAFYRSDGSIFFSSIIHEGECTLTPFDEEDVSDIVSNKLWYLWPPDCKKWRYWGDDVKTEDGGYDTLAECIESIDWNNH